MSDTLHAYTGHLAGLTTSVLWSISPLLFTAAAKRLGPTVVNALRIAFAIVLLGVTHRLLSGHWVPVVAPRQAAYLAFSGLLGLAIGDQLLLTAFLEIGPRLASLVMTAAPLFAGLFGAVVLGERLPGVAWLGIALTLGGVGWVLRERPAGSGGAHHGRRTRGVVLSVGAAACQAAGLLLSKQGMGHGWLAAEDRMAPQTATLVRMVFAGLAMVPLVFWRWRRGKQRAASAAPRAGAVLGAGVAFAACGAVAGPFLGVWMSLVASDRAPLGVAQTLCSLPPVIILPLAFLVHGERVSPRAVLGALVAVGGIALLFLMR